MPSPCPGGTPFSRCKASPPIPTRPRRHARACRDCTEDRSRPRACWPPPPGPDSLPSRWASLSDRYGDDLPNEVGARWPVDLRHIDHLPWSDSTARPRNRIWLRSIRYPRQVAAADAAALAFATDLPMFEPVYFPTGTPWRDMVGHTAFLGATLSHSVWFHRPSRVDEWLLLDQVAPIAHGYRAFCRGELRSRAGQLVASVAQEMLFVPPRQTP